MHPAIWIVGILTVAPLLFLPFVAWPLVVRWNLRRRGITVPGRCIRVVSDEGAYFSVYEYVPVDAAKPLRRRTEGRGWPYANQGEEVEVIYDRDNPPSSRLTVEIGDVTGWRFATYTIFAWVALFLPLDIYTVMYYG
ncbi:DUF3592 domain-containing protein [Streptomyces sporangiiformans]|uniref:DUF3592 domain-containing protein n=1 Tax=Streptomyces sporangiiformans TaxID=2315329 RepID=A0A505DIL3_9ACTN|nr:DUF3592 domain-containing protein [Streptomyces sporangiiformans]TPQ21755.1 hypothetical protein FGD71_013265 [Streptomyces sporangiiformans]